jgi:aspartokinase/homoserine dehydrogenase 1
MRILKFGGTSVGTPESILQVIDIVKAAMQNMPVAVVVSAFGGVTDHLIRMSDLAACGDEQYKEAYTSLEQRHLEAIKALIHARRHSGVTANMKYLLNELYDVLHGIFLVKEISPKTRDFILSFGERLSATIIAEAFQEKGVQARFVDARELIVTDGHFGNASVDFEATDPQIRDFFAKSDAALHVIPGFIGSTPYKETTTLGRGGSDYTGSIFAAALQADILEIWTDVNGMMTADPKKVKNAFSIPDITYEEAMELSYFGAKVIYPPSIQPAYRKQIPILIKNTFEPENPGTVISNQAKPDERPIRGISSMKDVAMITLEGSGMIGVAGTSARLFSALASRKVNVSLISQASSEHSISIAVDEKAAQLAVETINQEFRGEIAEGFIDTVSAETGLSVIAIVGRNMKSTPGVSGKLFSSLGRNGINVLAIAQGASELNVSFVIRRADEAKALNVIHESFFLSETKVLHLFIAGITGKIGVTLLEQMQKQLTTLRNSLAVDIRIIGMVNTRQMLIEKEGIAPEKALVALQEKGKPADIAQFIEEMVQVNLPNSVFIDCTASQVITDCYARVLQASISIVTPNKLACSGDYGTYVQLKKIAHKRNVKFLFETNVGAGLPVIGTLNDLINSGDKIIKIEAILSGTLNYIFNNVSKLKMLSEVVLDAMDKGYTEPDPRIDLSGSDVARKILILARELGHHLNIGDVVKEQFLPEACFEAENIPSFFDRLKAFDVAFEEQRAQLDAKGHKYRVIATLESGKPSVSLRTFDPSHPFYTAAGSDNIILFTTNRYLEQPLMIKGPGAGAEVTAAGVFADIIRIAN